jgi:hypothetical protein
MTYARSLGLMVSGGALLFMSIALMVSYGTSAEFVNGTWKSTTPNQGYTDSTWPGDYTFDAVLTLDGDGYGSFWLECTNVVVKQQGWGVEGKLGMTQTVDVDYVVLGSSVTITIYDPYGGVYDLDVTVSGNRMTGSGTYEDIGGTFNSWTMDLTKSGGGTSSVGLGGLGAAAGGAALGGFLVGFGVSILPPPRFMGGSNLPLSNSPLGTPYAPSQSLVLNHQISSMANQPPGSVTRPLPDVPRMRMHLDPIQFPNVEMGKTTVVQPNEVRSTDVLSKRTCPNCGSTLMVTAGGWSCPFCNRAPPGGLDPR